MPPHAQRRQRLTESWPDSIDCLLVTDLVNLRYLTGFTGSNGAVLMWRDGALLATDGRYVTQAAAEAPDLQCVEVRSAAAGLVAEAARRSLSRVGVEADHVSVTLFQRLSDAADGAVQLVASGPLVEPMRAVKDATELAALARACEVTDTAFATVAAALRPGVSERAVAWALRQAIHEAGGAGLAFDSIVAFGSNSAIPHHQPTDRTLARGDLVKLDFGALYDGYHADMTRTVVAGPAAGWQRDLHTAVADIQQARRGECVVGAMPRELDSRATRDIEASGHRAAHGLGHGVGLQIHEEPFLTPGSMAGPLAEAVAITVEPGIYLAGRGGVRIEDTVVVTDSVPTVLTTSSRALIEVG